MWSFADMRIFYVAQLFVLIHCSKFFTDAHTGKGRLIVEESRGQSPCHLSMFQIHNHKHTPTIHHTQMQKKKKKFPFRLRKEKLLNFFLSLPKLEPVKVKAPLQLCLEGDQPETSESWESQPIQSALSHLEYDLTGFHTLSVKLENTECC